MIKRGLQDQLEELIGYFPAVGIIGPRQVGKTTLAKALVKNIDKECIYLDLEKNSDLLKLEDAELYLSRHLDKCIIIDEVQRKPDLFPLLRSLIDENRQPARFILLGSAAPELIRDSSESLAGRIAYIELPPFNILEVKDIIDQQEHWLRGGFPSALLAPRTALAQTWTENFIKTYIERDLPLLGMPASPVLTQKLWTMLAHYHGGIVNYSDLSKSLGITVPTVKHYIDFMESAFLIKRLQPYQNNVKKRLVKSPKIYIRDTGILHVIAGIENVESLYGNIIIGNSWEGYVIEQITQIAGSKIKSFFYRTHGGAECDLILFKGNKLMACIEIKLTDAPHISKGFLEVINDLKSKNNFIITPSSDDYLAKENIRICNLICFLEQHLPKTLLS